MKKLSPSFFTINGVVLLNILIICSCTTEEIMKDSFYSGKSRSLYNELLEISKTSEWTNLNSKISNEMKNKYGIKEENNELYVGAILKINEMYDDEDLWINGIIVGTRLNSIVSVKIPLYAYLSLYEVDGIDYVQIDSDIKLSN